MNLSLQKVINVVDADPEELVSFLEKYFSEQEKGIMFYYRFTLLDLNQKKFKLEKTHSASSWIRGRVLDGRGSTIELKLHPPIFLLLAIIIIWNCFMMLISGYFLLALLLIGGLLILGDLKQMKDYVSKINEGIEAFTDKLKVSGTF